MRAQSIHQISLDEMVKAIAISDDLAHLNREDIELVIQVLFDVLGQINGKFIFESDSITRISESDQKH